MLFFRHSLAPFNDEMAPDKRSIITVFMLLSLFTCTCVGNYCLSDHQCVIHGKVAVLTIDAPVAVWENIVDQTQTVDQENAVIQIFVVAIVGNIS